ncbi:MAG TPA: hypothetical protein VKV39_02430 [Candidatus Sulfotelmatobacter sp.]|nr:hypothetical protein [Candidatus Sulfotelmatobacter sp.]
MFESHITTASHAARNTAPNLERKSPTTKKPKVNRQKLNKPEFDYEDEAACIVFLEAVGLCYPDLPLGRLAGIASCADFASDLPREDWMEPYLTNECFSDQYDPFGPITRWIRSQLTAEQLNEAEQFRPQAVLKMFSEGHPGRFRPEVHDVAQYVFNRLPGVQSKVNVLTELLGCTRSVTD